MWPVSAKLGRAHFSLSYCCVCVWQAESSPAPSCCVCVCVCHLTDYVSGAGAGQILDFLGPKNVLELSAFVWQPDTHTRRSFN